MSRLLKRYFLNEDGSTDKRILELNCADKIFYHALCDFKLNNKDFDLIFLSDFNLIMDENISKFEIYKNINLNDLKSPSLRELIFQVDLYTPDSKDAIHLLDKLIDTGFVVALRTMFDMLPQYIWYSMPIKKGVGDHHSCFLVGYDDKHYFIAEEEGMLRKECYVAHPDNPTVSLINKNEMLKALEVLCEIVTVKVNEEQLSQLVAKGSSQYFEHVKRKIVENYFSEENDMHLSKTIIGKQALQKFGDYVSTGRNEYIEPLIVESFFFHQMGKRREIFLRCLIETEGLDAINHEIINYLKNIIENYDVLKAIAIRHFYSKPVPDVGVKISKRLMDTIYLEEKLFELLAKSV